LVARVGGAWWGGGMWRWEITLDRHRSSIDISSTLALGSSVEEIRKKVDEVQDIRSITP